MALNSTTLAADIKSRLISKCGAIDGFPLTDFCTEIAQAVINHIKSNGVVSTTVSAGIAVQVSTLTGTGSTVSTGVGSGTIS